MNNGKFKSDQPKKTKIIQGATPSTELRCKTDACEAVTKDIMKIINERLSGIDKDFDAECEKHKLKYIPTPNMGLLLSQLAVTSLKQLSWLQRGLKQPQSSLQRRLNIN